MDGDAIISTNNKVLLRNTKATKTVLCEQKSIPKQSITEKKLKDANKNGFGNSVGIVTNRATAMFDVISQFEKGSKEHEDMMFRIVCMQGYQQEVIDSCKGIVAKQVPREWYDFKSIKINDTDSDDVKELKKYNEKLLADKKPYFFIYNYPKLHQEYKNYIKVHNNSCIIRFGISLDELLKKEVLSKEEKEFIFYYKKYIPVSDFSSTMNRICHKIEFLLDDVKTNVKTNNLDMSFLITNKRANDDIRNGLLEVYKDYKKGFKTKDRAGEDDVSSQRSLWLAEIEKRVFSVCNDIEVVANELIRLSDKHESARGLLWHTCGEYIVGKLLEQNNGYITFPTRCSDGDVVWDGEKFKLTKERVSECLE